MRISFDTVKLVFSGMKVLCGSIKVSNQRGVLTSLHVSHQDPLEDTPEKAEEEGDPTQVSLYILNGTSISVSLFLYIPVTILSVPSSSRELI